MNLIQFLEARVAEDERAALAAFSEDRQQTRAMREVAFKRATLGEFWSAANWDFTRPTERQDYPRLLTSLAAVYADHPDFDLNWAPSSKTI